MSELLCSCGHKHTQHTSMGCIERLACKCKLDQEGVIAQTAAELEKLRADRDELLTAMEKIAKFDFTKEKWEGTRILGSEDYERKVYDFMDIASASIAKVKGDAK